MDTKHNHLQLLLQPTSPGIYSYSHKKQRGPHIERCNQVRLLLLYRIDAY